MQRVAKRKVHCRKVVFHSTMRRVLREPVSRLGVISAVRKQIEIKTLSLTDSALCSAVRCTGLLPHSRRTFQAPQPPFPRVGSVFFAIRSSRARIFVFPSLPLPEFWHERHKSHYLGHKASPVATYEITVSRKELAFICTA